MVDRTETDGAKRLRAWMLRQDISQTQAGVLLGVSQGTVSQWLLGRDPSLKDACTVELVAHVPVRAWLR